MIDIVRADLESRGWGVWATEIRKTSEFIGYIALSIPKRALPFMPCVEVGYRLAKEFWGRGYATEGAKAAVRFGFERLELTEVVSFTALVNRRSRAVMERLGMSNAGEDFDHPALPEGHPLRRHCLYRLGRHQWAITNPGRSVSELTPGIRAPHDQRDERSFLSYETG